MTGITSNAEISKIPTIGIAREIVTADKIIKIVFILLVLMPDTNAESSSKVVNNNSLYNIMTVIKTTIPRMQTV